MPRWGMVVDLRKCIGCGTCKEICDRMYENHMGGWRRVIETEAGDGVTDRGSRRIYLTMSCMQCDDPPCRMVCPTGATYSRKDGIVEIEDSLCMGCGACIIACPYRARILCAEDSIPRIRPSAGLNENTCHDRLGVVTKCSFCSHIIDDGVARGLVPGVDSEATPLCVRFCISGALSFGDLDDNKSAAAKLIQENTTILLLEEMDTKPKMYFIPK